MSGDGPTTPPPLPGREMKLTDLAALNYELAALARAGVPMERGLRQMSRGDRATARTTRQLQELLESGTALPEALEATEAGVPRWYRAVVAAGIRSGQLGKVLLGLNRQLASQIRLRKRVLEALWYPAIIVTLVVLFVFWAIRVFQPRFYHAFYSLDRDDPTGSGWGWMHAMIWLSEVLSSPWFWVGTVAAMVVLYLVWRKVRHSTFAERIVWRVPMVGPMCRDRAMSRFFAVLGILVEERLPLGEAVELAAEGSGSGRIIVECQHLRRDLDAGTALGPAMNERPLFRGFAAWMSGHAQKQARLPDGLAELTQLHAEETDRRAALVIAWMPPLALVLSATVAVAVFIVTMWGPMVAILQKLMRQF